MVLIAHSQVIAGEAVGPQSSPQVDALAVRIADARKAVLSAENELNELMALGKALYLGGVQRPDEPWLKESYDVWDELLARYPEEPLVKAYAGSVRVLQARDAFFPWTKGNLLKQGQRLLTEARSQSPGNMQVIWLQAVTAYHLPEKFGQREAAVKNFATLAGSLEATQTKDDKDGNKADGVTMTDTAEPGLEENSKGVVMKDNLEPAMKASVWYYRGLELEKHSDLTGAMAAWQRSVKAEPESTAAKAAARCLSAHASQAASQN